jgi:hypothetical protein
MRTQVNRRGSGFAWVAVAAWLSLVCAASCLSGDEAPAGGRLEHPQPRAPMPVSSAEQDGGPPLPVEPFSALDKAIANDCVSTPSNPSGIRPWSQDVPDRDCTNDGECGDGFCDREHCAPIWTCNLRYGQRCVDGRAAPNYWGARQQCEGICLDGRCRSCESDAECVNYNGAGGPKCTARGRYGGMCLAGWSPRHFMTPPPSK